MAKKYKITQLQNDNSLLELHPETDADIVNYNGTISGQTVTNVKGALDIIAGGIGVTGVKGNKEVNYRTGQVNLTPANIGAQAEIPDSDTTMASESNNVVTIYKTVKQVDGAVSAGTGTITLGTAAKKSYTTSVTSGSTDLVTSGAVWSAIDNLPEPMVFKGTLGTNGTITTLPTAATGNQGYTYKVITAGTYASQAAKVGDVFTSTGTAWVLIPSGDETFTDTWRDVSVNGDLLAGNSINTGGINILNGSGISVTGDADVDLNITFSLADGYGDSKNPYTSKTKNYVLAAPSSANGAPSFRKLVASDIPDLSGTYQPKDADLTAIGALTGTAGLLKKTAANTWALDTNVYITENQNITLTGDITGSGKTSIATTLKNSGVTAGTYSAVTVNAKGIVTAGGQFVEVGTTGQTAPSASLAVGGLFFKEI